MNEQKSRQGEGYDFYDYDELVFNAVGGAEVAYIVGTNARAAMPGMGALDAAIWPVSETYPPIPAVAFPGLACPHDAQDTQIFSDQPVQIRVVSRAIITRWLASVVAGAPISAWPIPVLQVTYPANAWFVIPDKWAIIYVVGTGAGGTLLIKASG